MIGDTQDRTVMGRLAAADPARHLQDVGSASDPMLQELLLSPRRGAVRGGPPRRGRRAVAVAGGVLGAAALGVAGALVLNPGPAAFASWTAVPRDVTESDVAELDDVCADAAVTIVDGATEDVPVEPVLTEARGDYLFEVGAGEAAYATCFVDTTGAPFAVGSSAVFAEPLPAVAAEELTVEENGTASWSGDGGGLPGQLTLALGLAGDDVVAVVVTTDDGEEVDATVAGGWWAAWSPDADSLQDEAVVTFADGTSETVDLAQTGAG